MLEQMCRTCLATCGELVPIFSNDYYVHNLPDKLLHTTKIEVLKDDALPKLMCKKCIFLVDSLYCFKDQCEMAEIKLKKTLKGILDDDICLSKNDSTDGNYDLYNYEEGVEILSDDLTSSEEEYHIEYVSEEARLEVENARRRSRNARKRRNKYRGLKVTSVEILPTESKNNIYKNLNTPSSFKNEVTEYEEDINISDNDGISSMYTSEGSKKLRSNKLKKKKKNALSNSIEKINFFKNQKQKFQDNTPLIKLGSKRKLESIDSYNRLTKVPKKVMFKENDYNDENIQFIEVTENEVSKPSEKVQDELSIVSNSNASHNGSEKVTQNYNNLINNDNDNCNNLVNSIYDVSKSSDGDTKRVLEIRMQNLTHKIVLNIPKACTICSVSFSTYLDVLKHKIESHLSSDQDFCPICQEKFFDNNSLIQHVNEHKDIRSFICILCSGHFYTEDTLRNHLYSHVDLRDLRCHICSKKFIRIQTLLNHLEQHIASKQLVCMLCTETNFKDKDVLQKHINKEHTKQQGKCESSDIKVLEEVKVEKIKNNINFPCPYCENIFTTKTILRDHVLTHLGVQQYSCLVCEKTFATQDERTQHMQEHMQPQQKSDQKKFRCRVCHEILVSRVAYGHHLKEKHWSAKQTSEILQELSESSLNEKVNEQVNKSSGAPTTPESIS